MRDKIYPPIGIKKPGSDVPKVVKKDDKKKKPKKKSK